MKQAYLCLNLIFLPYLTFAQSPFNFVSSQPHGRFTAIDANDSGQLIAVGSHKSCAEGYAVFFDTDNSVLWEIQLDQTLAPATDVFFNDEGNIVVFGTRIEESDAGSTEDIVYLLRLDTLGNTLSTTIIQSDSLLGKKALGLQLSDSRYLSAVGKQLYWISSEGDSLGTLKIAENDIIDLDTGPDGNILVLTESDYYWLDENGTILDQQTAVIQFLAACSKQDTSWILGYDFVSKISGDITNIESFPVPFQSTPEGIACLPNDEGVYLWDKDGSNYRFFHLRAGSGVELNFSALPYSSLNEVIIRDTQIILAGTQLWQIPDGDFSLEGAFIERTALAGRADTAVHDIELQFVDLTPAEPLDTVDVIPVDDTTTVYNVEAVFSGNITVSNPGNTPIESFVFFSERLGGFHCSEGRHYQLVEDVLINPGESITVPVTFNDVLFLSNSEPLLHERCFFVAAPNHHFDPDLANNRSCEALLSNTRERINPELALRIVPNPANDHFLIQLEKDIPIRGFSLFDLNGRVQSVDHSIQFNQVAVTRSDLPAGMYIVYLQTASGLVTHKVVLR